MIKAEWDNLPQPGEGKPDPEVNVIISTFLVHYSAVDSFAEADFTPSTGEIYFQLLKLYPTEAFTQATVYHALKKEGFIFDMVPGTGVFLWLMKRKLPSVL